MPPMLIVAFEGVLAGLLLLAPTRRVRASLVAALLALILGLAALSPPRQVGDSPEYVAMALNLARFSRPSLTTDDLVHARTLFPGDAGTRLESPRLRAPDGRQDLPHFWFYSLLAAPFVRAALAVGADPVTGFAALNILMLAGVVTLLAARLPPATATLVAASPVLWWADKAHTEVFMFSCIAVALMLLRSAPWWSIAALGTAATQNPATAIAMPVVVAFAFYRCGRRDRRVWAAAAAGAALAALHPLYYHARLGMWSGLTDAVDRHWPSIAELTAVLLDPNLSIFVHDPFLSVAVVVALLAALPQPGQRTFDLADAAVALIAGLFIISFTQTTNFNSGGTPGPSRYGLWLVPFAVPALARVRPAARWIRVLAMSSTVWCAWAFAPAMPDLYLRPSTLAADVWRWWPSLDNPLAEVFAERVSGHEPARPPLATAGCEKVLLVGDGVGAAWPARCPSAPLPEFCQQQDALCYANQEGGAYRFARAPASPAWHVGISGPDPDAIQGMLVVTQPNSVAMPISLWHETGWSYAERLSGPAPDVVSREWRWIDQHALVGVHTAEPVVARLKIVARAFNKPRRLRISVGSREVATMLVMATIGVYGTPEFTLEPGDTLMTFDSLDGSEVPATGDQRRLSIQVFRTELVARR